MKKKTVYTTALIIIKFIFQQSNNFQRKTKILTILLLLLQVVVVEEKELVVGSSSSSSSSSSSGSIVVEVVVVVVVVAVVAYCVVIRVVILLWSGLAYPSNFNVKGKKSTRKLRLLINCWLRANACFRIVYQRMKHIMRTIQRSRNPFMELYTILDACNFSKEAILRSQIMTYFKVVVSSKVTLCSCLHL